MTRQEPGIRALALPEGRTLFALRAQTQDRAAARVLRQSITSLALEVRPELADVLRARVDDLNEAQERGSPEHNLIQRIPVLHFLSMTVFPGRHHDPVLVIEANVDGPADHIWFALEAVIGPQLRDLLRCCKPPRDDDGTFSRLVEPQSTATMGHWLRSRASRPAVGHMGNRGLNRARIEQERALFEAVQRQLEDRAAFAGLDQQAIHARLRQALLPDFPWLRKPGSPRITRWESLGDWARVAGFAAAVLLTLAVPAILAGLLIGWWWVPLLSLVGSLLLLPPLRRELDELSAQPKGDAAGSLLRWRWLWVFGGVALLSGILPVLLALLLGIRRLERRDPPQEAPPVDEAEVQRMMRVEDRRMPDGRLALQNHMGSVVLGKPGLLRALLLPTALRGLGLLLRALPETRRGYLASMRTIHFAHWVLISNGGRLVFFSNFDGTWESYLDDFIEKAHGGLTLAWGSCVGFPTARFLWFEGATQGRRFKAWARSSMTVARLWVSAYPDLTVEQIERNHEIAEGLRRSSLPEKELEAWTAQL